MLDSTHLLSLFQLFEWVCRCAANLCDLLMWHAPLRSYAKQRQQSASGLEPDRAGPSGKGLLRSEVDAYCQSIMQDVKVSPNLCIAAAVTVVLNDELQIHMEKFCTGGALTPRLLQRRS